MAKKLTVDERLALIEKVAEQGEIVTTEDLRTLLETKPTFIAYDGFEPSGTIHIAQGLLRVININRMIKAGAHFKMWVADWHAWANNKMGGDLEKIKVVGEYFIEVWKAAGLDHKGVEFLWASDVVKDDAYWKIVMQVARNNTVKRIIRCSQIMGRSESEDLAASQILYPCMQCADIFYLNVDICQLGLDQRKVNMLAREMAPKLGFKTPVAVHHHMMMGLTEPAKADASAVDRAIAMKMSKSNPASAIFMTDSEDDIKKKLNKAYCPEGQIADNPVLEYFKYIIFALNEKVDIVRPEKFGGNLSFGTYDELAIAFSEKKIHPVDLKQTAARYINDALKPVRDHFVNDKRAAELLAKVKSYQVTR
ncbi:MAG TPA: tyrosine--tRNA ligase [Acidobacteriota bacterium]|nr:tyrosine--tRNA ligase [Acidobacteriota bacterium]